MILELISGYWLSSCLLKMLMILLVVITPSSTTLILALDWIEIEESKFFSFSNGYK